MSKAGVLAEPVLVGREKEMEELQSLLNFAVEGKGKTVFVSGEAGSGKTRLCREFLNAARKEQIGIMAGWCLSDVQVPYFPFVEAFNSYYASSEAEQVEGLSESGKPLSPSEPFQTITQERGMSAWLTGATPALKLGKLEIVSPQVWKDQLFAGVAKTLHTIASQAPVILFIEDAHWADSASLALLHYVARAIHDSERVLLLATFRSEELTADAEGHPHPLAETLRMMRREELFTEISLSSLSQTSVSKMAESMIGGSLQQELARKLAAESRGNPLFVVESLRMLHERRSLVQENNEWRLAVDELGIPNKIKDIILRRLAYLKYAQRRVLDAASVIGEEFDVELLSTVLGQDSLDVLETLNVVAHSTSLVCVEENRYRFGHARSRDTIYEELSPPLRQGYHKRVAEKLESAKSGMVPLSDLSYHYEEAGNKEKAVKYALAAAKDELARWSNAQAIKHFQYVLENIGKGNAEEKRTALEGLGDAYAASYMYAEAIKTFDELATSETGTVKLRAIRKAMDAAYSQGDKPDPLLDYARKAEELAVYDRLEMARIIDNRGKAWGWSGRGDFKMDLADYDAALQVFEEENSIADVAEALWRSGVVCTTFDYLREKGLGELLRSVAIFRDLGNIRKETEATLWNGIGLAVSFLFSEAKREYANVIRNSEKLGVFAELAQASYFLSMLETMEGKLAEATGQSLKGLEYCKKTDANWVEGTLYAMLVIEYSLLGDFKQADEYFEKMSKLSPEIFSQIHVFVNAARAKGVYFAVKNRWDESNEAFEKILEFLKKYGMFMFDPEVRGNYAWALEKQGRFDEAKVQRDIVQELLNQAEERFGHTNLQLGLMVPRKVHVGEEFEMRLDLANVSRKPGSLDKIEGLALPEFKFSRLPCFCSLRSGNIVVKDKSVGPFEVETINLKLSATKAGNYNLNPAVCYADDSGKTKEFKLNPITITAEPVKPAYETLPGRITTGTMELDRLLLGGIPERYAVALIAPSFEERQKVVEQFVEAGPKSSQRTFYLTVDPGSAKTLVEEYPSIMYIFVCNPRADLMVKDLPNVYKTKGVDNLTEIDIALMKALRQLDSSQASSKRACIEIVSDVLLQHHAVTTRKWVSGLIQELRSKGFTTMAVLDPLISPEEVPAILSLFDGEIRINEKENAEGRMKTLKILKLHNQNYLKDEVTLS